MKRICLAFLLSLMAIALIFPFGKKETVDTSTPTLDSWLETVDISASKPGKYNILVTAEDLAGNQGLAGPFNMYIDPKSDLPVARITNPLDGMRVPGNLNVVGTCIDDDKVDHVELILDGSETAVTAAGTQFWSYYLDTNGLAEGAHTISVYGVDVNGVRGEPYSVLWHLDRNRPETGIAEPVMGSLVSGKFSLSGRVADGNGIRRLAYSLDGGTTFAPLDLEFDRKAEVWTFGLNINSLKMADGPAVCWFRAEDGQGSIGYYTFLYFIDNTRPSVEWISPAEQEPINGSFSVSGTANDVIGIASLSWRMGKETGAFELIKGNPYWIHEFDVRGTKAKSVTVEITAVDIAGNRTVVQRKIPVDASADVPALSLLSPSPGALVSGPVEIAGFARDDDGIASIGYSVDKGAAAEVASRGELLLSLGDLAAGTHSVELWPVDVNGLRGASVTLQFTAAGAPPEISLDALPGGGTEINPESGAAVGGMVRAAAGLKSLGYTLDGAGEKTLPVRPGSTEAAFKIPVLPDWPYGVVRIEIFARDIHDRETRYSRDVYITNLGIPRDTPSPFPDSALTVSGAVTIPASGKESAGTGTATVTLERVLPDAREFANGMTVTLAGPAVPKERRTDAAVRVGIESPVAVSSVSWTLSDGTAGKVAAVKTGETRYEALVSLRSLLAAEWTTLGVTVAFKDSTSLAVSGTFCVVRPAPGSGVNDGEQFVWGEAPRNANNNILLLDGAPITGLFNGKSDLEAASAAFEKPVDGLSVSAEGNSVTVRGTKDGEYPGVVLVITDTAGGKFRAAPVTFIVDGAPPALSLDTSSRPLYLQGTLPVKGLATDARGISSVRYSFDGGASWAPFPAASFDQKIDISALPDGLVDFLVSATDKSGRETTARRAFIKDTVPPEAEVVFPAPGDTVNGETRIGFRLVDANPVVSAEYRAPGDRTAKDKTEWKPLALSSMTNTLVGTADQPISDRMEFRFTDAAGNASVTGSYSFTVDANADLPVVEIHLPAENEVLRKDFVISGVVYDDDQNAKVWYKIDKGAFVEVPVENSYSIPVTLESLSDNEHTITLYAEDIHGVRGPEVTRTVRVSLEEPKAEVRAPSFETTNRGVIDITGVASDRNGIAKVEVSLDNGNSFNLAAGAEQWSYRFDSRVIEDGTHVVFVRVYDKYDTVGLYSSLVNLDNTAPSIRLELPLDGSRTGETLFISGQTLDNIGLERVSARISNIEPKQPAIPSALSDIPFGNELIISSGVDIKALPEGFYNLEVRGYDKAGNITRVSRNFEVFRGKDRNRIEFLYPMNGENVQGMFNLYGRVVSEEPANSLMLYIDDVDVAASELTPSGFFKFTVTPEMISDGTHKINVRALIASDKIITSEDRFVIYRADGPWVTVDNFAMGDFAIDRPWLMGTAGYSFTEDDILALRAKDTPPDTRRRLQEKSLEKVEISFDNGKTFVPTESGKKWRFRIETGDLNEGYHFLIVRATMKNGEVAVSRSIIQIDKTAPTIRLISPGEGGSYNNELVFSGLSSDDVELASVLLSLRPGDKSAYAVPSFIQGLYFDWHFWGATLYDIGVGLTFFDDNVKIQGQFGQFTAEQRAIFTPNSMRYGGNVLGLKMLANLAYVPMDFFFGPDFTWLSATAAIGANFSMFSESQSGKPQILSALLAQVEFPRVTIPKRKTFRTFSLYGEIQFWFIPTDVDSAEVNINSILPHFTGGIRVNMF